MPGALMGSSLSLMGEAMVGAKDAQHTTNNMLTASGRFKIDSAGSNVNVVCTSPGGSTFQPKAIIFVCALRTHPKALGADGIFAVGIGTGTDSFDNRGVGIAIENAAATTDTWRAQDDTNSSLVVVDDTGAHMTGIVQTLNADGFTFNPGVPLLNDTEVYWFALGGDAITNVALDKWQPQSGSSASRTGIGFQPDFLMTISVSSTNTGSVEENEAAVMISFATAADSFVSFARSDSGAAAASGEVLQRTGRFLYLSNNAGGTLLEKTLTSLDSDGWTYANIVHDNNRTFYTLALKGGQYKVGSFDCPSTAIHKSVTGIAFPPQGGMFLTQGRSTSTALATDACRLSLGMAAGPEQRAAIAFDDVDAASPSQAYSMATGNAIAARVNAAGPSLTIVGDLLSFDSAGFTSAWSVADGTARECGYVLFGGGTTYTSLLGGTVAPVGTLVKVANKVFTGTVTSSGALRKFIDRFLAGSIATAGSLTASALRIRAYSGAIATAGTLVKQVNKSFAGTIASSGALTTVALKFATLSGAITPTGILETALRVVKPGLLGAARAASTAINVSRRFATGPGASIAARPVVGVARITRGIFGSSRRGGSPPGSSRR